MALDASRKPNRFHIQLTINCDLLLNRNYCRAALIKCQCRKIRRTNRRSRVAVVFSLDTMRPALTGLLNLHWQLPGYQSDFCAPGGAEVFEFRQIKNSKEYIVRVFLRRRPWSSSAI